MLFAKVVEAAFTSPPDVRLTVWTPLTVVAPGNAVEPDTSTMFNVLLLPVAAILSPVENVLVFAVVEPEPMTPLTTPLPVSVAESTPVVSVPNTLVYLVDFVYLSR